VRHCVITMKMELRIGRGQARKNTYIRAALKKQYLEIVVGWDVTTTHGLVKTTKN